MGLRRRDLLRGLAAIAGAWVVTLLPVADRILPARCTEALRTWAYPGRIRPLRMRDVARPGRWMG